MKASLALQNAVVAAWNADARLSARQWRIFDGPPADARPPYATVGSDVVVPRDWAGGRGFEHRFTISVWDSGNGLAAVKEMMAEAERVVLTISADIIGFRLVSLRLLRAVAKGNPKGWAHGTMEFRAMTCMEI